jgi:hypothetical protein
MLVRPEAAIYEQLRVWVDANHDGISQASELYTLASLDIKAIRLRAELSEMTDPFGNAFRFRSVLRDSTGGSASKVIYDVYLTLGSSRVDDATEQWFATPSPVGFVEDGMDTAASHTVLPQK